MIIAVLVAMLGANSLVRSPNKLCLSIYQEAISIFNLDIASFLLCTFRIDETARRYPKGQVLLVLLWGFAECGNRKALRLRVQGVYLCK